jgi:hypothetical protein
MEKAIGWRQRSFPFVGRVLMLLEPVTLILERGLGKPSASKPFAVHVGQTFEVPSSRRRLNHSAEITERNHILERL